MRWRRNGFGSGDPLDGKLGSFLFWLGGFAAEDRLTADLGERELRRIRASQIAAVTRQIPVSMAVTMLNVGIVLMLFWDTGWNSFLSAWALTLTAMASIAL